MESYSVELCRQLAAEFSTYELARPLRVERYDPGDVLEYEIHMLDPAAPHTSAGASLRVERFVGGGFASQVYKVTLLAVRPASSTLVPGSAYALKILVPPSAARRFFRDLLYGIGFQGPFQLQVNPVATRAGALWHKFIQRAAACRLQDRTAVNDVYATLVDRSMGSCGEISQWVDGRTWRLEVDDRVDRLARWERDCNHAGVEPGSPEYRSKKVFMRELVELLHEMGAHELARQYEWSTWKSQTNVLKRLSSDPHPQGGLTAVDFCAGLALLPILPMSPGDPHLIVQGLRRGSLVQFDRGDLGRLEEFVAARPDQFADMLPLLQELKQCEQVYRDSVPDLAHHGLRLLSSRKLWATLMASAVTGWRVRGLIGRPAEERLRRDRSFLLLFALLGFIPVLGGVLRKYLGRPDYRIHYRRLLSDTSYFRRAVLARRTESLLDWHRSGRVTEQIVRRTSSSFPLYLYHLALSVLPLALHRALSDRQYLRARLQDLFVRPVRLYFDEAERRMWLLEMVGTGRERGIVSDEDAQEILSQVNDPYIHRYLKSLAVHVCLAPTTHVFSLGLAAYYLLSHPDMPRAQAYAVAAGIVALFQVIPVSPGSVARGLYVMGLAIRERKFRDYSIALTFAFFKYVGYLSFPLQMAYRYPTLARFMAGYWATNTVPLVPVFGERGALLEHKVFRLFYNLPLTLRRKMGEREALRRMRQPRLWHAALIVVAIALAGAAAEILFIWQAGSFPTLRQIAPALAVGGFLGGIFVNLGSGGASSVKRLLLAVGSGVALGLLLTVFSFSLNPEQLAGPVELLSRMAWSMFIAATVSALGAALAELKV
ncbi:MAG: hypothetical protein ACM3QS_07260 [Bacteroidota bacterium]